MMAMLTVQARSRKTVSLLPERPRWLERYLGQPWSLQPIDLSSPALRQGNNTLLLHVMDGCSQPQKFDPANQDPRCFSVGMQQLRVAPLPPGT